MARFVGDERINYKLSHFVINLLAQKNDVGKKNVEIVEQIQPHSYMYLINDPWTDFGRVSWSPWCVWGPMEPHVAQPAVWGISGALNCTSMRHYVTRP